MRSKVIVIDANIARSAGRRELAARRRFRRVVLTQDQRNSIRRSLNADQSGGIEDVHLILVALRASNAVFSRDDEARTLFATRGSPKITAIHWINPCTDKDPIPWLENGLTGRDDLKLANFQALH